MTEERLFMINKKRKEKWGKTSRKFTESSIWAVEISGLPTGYQDKNKSRGCKLEKVRMMLRKLPGLVWVRVSKEVLIYPGHLYW